MNMSPDENDGGHLRNWVLRSAGKANEWKRALAHHVVSHGFIHYGDSLLIGSGTTSIYVCKALVEAQLERREALDLPIVTSNFQFMYTMRDAQRKNGAIFGDTQVIMTGGRLNHSLDSLIGDIAARAVQDANLHPSLVIFGAAGLSFQEGMNMTYHFEEEISTQVAFATRPTVTRILLCDHTKMGVNSFYDANLSIKSLMETATNCYVITTYDPADTSAATRLEKEQHGLMQQLSELVERDDLAGKDFIFRMIRADGSVEREIRLDELRHRRKTSPVELPRTRSS
jgi:DeoR/GlpR family transcriptional regulator of sugar metabolism